MFCSKWDVNKLIRKILQDPERMDFTVDHDFEMKKQLTKEQIDFINAQIQGKVAYKIVKSEYSLPYEQEEGYETPYFVNTENVISLYNVGDFVHIKEGYGLIKNIQIIANVTIYSVQLFHVENASKFVKDNLVVGVTNIEDGNNYLQKEIDEKEQELNNLKAISRNNYDKIAMFLDIKKGKDD